MSNIFLKLDGIPGESCQVGRRDWVEVLEVQWWAGHKEEVLRGAGIPSFDPVKLVKRVDKSSPLLAVACATGMLLKDAIFEFVLLEKTPRSPDSKVTTFLPPFYRIRLGDVGISRVESRTVLSDDQRPDSTSQVETVTLDFAEIKWEYTELKPDGTKRGDIITGWSLKKVMPI